MLLSDLNLSPPCAARARRARSIGAVDAVIATAVAEPVAFGLGDCAKTLTEPINANEQVAAIRSAFINIPLLPMGKGVENLETETYLRRDAAIAGTGSSEATARPAESSKERRQPGALTEKRRRQIPLWRCQVYVIE